MFSLILVTTVLLGSTDAGIVADAGAADAEALKPERVAAFDDSRMSPNAAAPVLSAPLGHIGDVFTEVPAEGYPGTERVFTATLPGCDRPQAIWVSRFLMGSAVGGAQVHMYLAKQPALMKKLFGKREALADAIQRSRRTTAAANACAPDPSWKLSAAPRTGDVTCRQPVTTIPGDHLFVEKGRVAAVVRLSPAADDLKDRCRPKLSALLTDNKGVPRFAFHADYGGVLTAEVFGDACEQLTFNFDEETQTFVPTASVRAGCAAKAKTKSKK